MGTYGTGVGQFFNGLVSELRVWSTARTQAEILANMNNNLTGSESGLVGLWRGDNNFNDLTANANHLTATNGATATQNANPFNLIEYGKVTKVGAFSGGVTPRPSLPAQTATYLTWLCLPAVFNPGSTIWVPGGKR